MNWKFFALTLILGFMFSACAKVPFTGRKQTKAIPVAQINQMSFAEYDTFIQSNNTVKSGSEVEMVKKVGGKLVQAMEKYYRAEGLADKLLEFNWEFNVVKDDQTPNAFCMPGGKVVIYTGILPITKDEDGLAVVMGHEIAHAIAHHGNERMTQALGLQSALSGVDAFLSYRAGQSETAEQAQKRQQTHQVFMQAAGVGAQVGVILPFSRKHESEADKIGLYLMAIAGYDVRAAAPFWERMQAAGGGGTPEFLSTHPSPETRAQNLTEWAPEAIALAKKYQ
ncbi:MAG: M48 family metallopeptidase [Bacteroidota bacterium]